MGFVDLAQILSAIFTAIAAGAACWAVWDARMASRGQAPIALLDDYSAVEMGEALRELAQRSQGYEHDEKLLISMLTDGRAYNTPEFQRIDDCRRRLHWFIKAAVLLRKNGTIDDVTFKRAVVESNGYQLWASVALPLTREIEVHHRRSEHFNWADKGQDALRRFFKVDHDESGNQPPLPWIFPDKFAPIVRQAAGKRIMEMRRWGMPTPPQYLKPGAIDRGVTNIRNVNSPHWRHWLTPEFRCLVPVTAFAEPTDKADPATGKKRWAWFALSDDLPLFAFAGICCNWHATRGTKKNPEEGEHKLYGFLTTDANGDVRPIHNKAMPAILTTPEECETWLSAPLADALKLQRPLPNGSLQIVAMVEKPDAWPTAAE